MVRIQIACVIALVVSCTPSKVNEARLETGQAPSAKTAAWSESNSIAKLSDYWYQGKAEITRYTLEQNRYQDVHPGEAVMIFVTEDFLTDKQVKNDNYQNPKSVPILKNNMLRKFPTGIYDYSMMTSVFTPVGTKKYPQTLKVTSSSQEWCGHTYMQLNQKNQKIQMTLHSYFENEADQVVSIPSVIMEDEIFNRIRISPESLPTGKLKVLPNSMVLRLLHLPFEAIQAELSMKDYQGVEFAGEDLKVYTVSYPSKNRKLEIVFESEMPYQIVGWKDVYPSIFDGKPRETLAKATKTILSKYWSLNALSDMHLRTELGLGKVE